MLTLYLYALSPVGEEERSEYPPKLCCCSPKKNDRVMAGSCEQDAKGMRPRYSTTQGSPFASPNQKSGGVAWTANNCTSGFPLTTRTYGVETPINKIHTKISSDHNMEIAFPWEVQLGIYFTATSSLVKLVTGVAICCQRREENA